MYLKYHTTELHQNHTITVLDQSFDPPSGQRRSATLSVQIDVFGTSHTALRSSVDTLLALFRQQHKVLLWKSASGSSATTFVDQTAAVSAVAVPATEHGGSYRQTLNVSFSWRESDTAAVPAEFYEARFRKTGATNAFVPLGRVTSWSEATAVERVSALRDARRRVTVTINASGVLVPDGSSSTSADNMERTVDQRRASLLTLKSNLVAALREKSGTLRYGRFDGSTDTLVTAQTGLDQTVRVATINATVNHARDSIGWEITATYIQSPNESDYTAADFTIVDQSGDRDGSLVRQFSGSIRCESRSAADTKLTSLRATHKPTGYVRISSEVTESQADTDPDGNVFLSVDFNESYAKQAVSSSGIVSWAKTQQDSTDLKTGGQRRVISGTILAHHASSYASALTAAKAKASALAPAPSGGRKVREDFSDTDAQMSADHHTNLDGIFCALSYAFEYDLSEAAGMTVTKSGGSAVSMGRVLSWSEQFTSQRWSDLHSHRRRSAGRVSARGEYRATQSATQSARITALRTQQNLIEAAVNAKETTVAFGNFSKACRVASFNATINQGADALEWTLEAEFTQFPDESDYELVEFELVDSTEATSGRGTRTISGRIGAEDLSSATAKLNSLVSANSSGYVEASRNVTERRVDADDDGSTFLELQFSVTLQQSASSSVDDWTLRIEDKENRLTATTQRAYTGTVTARSSSSYAAARTAAVNKAESLGKGRHQFLLSATVQEQDNRMSADKDTTGDHVCTVEFGYEYRLKSASVFAEVSSSSNRDVFGGDTETVSGTVEAQDMTTARGVYDTIRAGYTGHVLISENITEALQKFQSSHSTTESGTTTDSNATTADEVLAVPGLGSGYRRQGGRLSFSFQLRKDKPSGRVGLQYAVERGKNYVSGEQTTTISGTVHADTLASAENALVKLGQSVAPTGKLTESRRTENSRQHGEGSTTTTKWDSLSFTDTYTSKLASSEAVLQCDVTVGVQHSGLRRVVQPTLHGRDLVQVTGAQGGRRVVSGSCMATTEAAARDWAEDQRALLTGRHPLPPRLDVKHAFTPLTSGDTTAGGANSARSVTVTFTFEEILTDEDYR